MFRGVAFMSSHQEELILQLPLDVSMAACERAVNGSGWQVTGRGAATLQGAELRQNAFSFTFPVQIVVNFQDENGTTRVILNGSNFGFGPIQSRHVKSQLQDLARLILDETTRPPTPVAGAPEKSRAVWINGVQIDDRQLDQIAQTYKYQMPDGHYWYDRLCGAWGIQGGPQCGIVVAGLALGGPLLSDASGGNTGVFVNGRQLHALDAAELARLFGRVMPGRWQVDALGNCGPEGGPIMCNLLVLAQSHSAGSNGTSGHGSGRYGWVTSAGFTGPAGSGLSAFRGQ